MSNWVDEILRKVANKRPDGYEQLRQLDGVCKRVAYERMTKLIDEGLPADVAYIIMTNTIKSGIEAGELSDLAGNIMEHYAGEWMAENGHWEVEV